MFNNCSFTKKIKLPYIPNYGDDLSTFCAQCSRLKELDLSPIHSKHITSIRDMCSYCFELEVLKMPQCECWDLKNEGYLHFCTVDMNLETIVMPNDEFCVKSCNISRKAFSKCDNLKEVDLRFMGGYRH